MTMGWEQITSRGHFGVLNYLNVWIHDSVSEYICSLSFITEDPGRQLMTGSFNPIDQGSWEEEAYV